MTQSLLNLHRMGYIHDDISMKNWLTQPGFYSMFKLIDFGKSIYDSVYVQRLNRNSSNKAFWKLENKNNRDIRRLGRIFERISKKIIENSQKNKMSIDLQIIINTVDDIIIGLKGRRKDEGMTLEEVVVTLENLLITYDKDSLFLSNNQDKLYKLSIKDSSLDHQRYITFDSCMDKYSENNMKTVYQTYVTCFFLLY